MDDMDDSPCKSIYIDFNGKYRRYSGLVENTPRIQSKRLKIERGELKEKSLKEEEALDLAMVEMNNFQMETTSRVKLTIIDKQENFPKRTFPKAKVGRPRKNKGLDPLSENNFQIDEILRNKLERRSITKQVLMVLDETNAKTMEYQETSLFNIKRILKNNKDKRKTAFPKEEEGVLKIKHAEKERDGRRLSGVLKRGLNTGFIEDSPCSEEEIAPKEEILARSYDNEKVNTVKKESAIHNTDKKGRSLERVPTTPIKSKLRQKPRKEPTQEEIIKYYTDKTIKKKQNTLETIFETPKTEPMSVKKYKRFINFNENMSTVKIKKRYSKIVKYHLWQNSEPVSMDYFERKLKEIEEDL